MFDLYHLVAGREARRHFISWQRKVHVDHIPQNFSQKTKRLELELELEAGTGTGTDTDTDTDTDTEFG